MSAYLLHGGGLLFCQWQVPLTLLICSCYQYALQGRCRLTQLALRLLHYSVCHCHNRASQGAYPDCNKC